MDREESFFIKTAYFLQDYWSHLATIISTVSFLFASFWFELWLAPVGQSVPYGKLRVAIGIFSVLLFIVGEGSSMRMFNYTTKLKKEKEGLEQLIRLFGQDYPGIWRARLGVIATDFRFTHAERISVYKPENEIFVMLGRFSLNPEFNRAGRGEYPLEQGCLGKAYREEKAIAMNLPDSTSSPEEYYKQMERDWNIPKKTMKKCKMKSRSYAAFSLKDETGLSNVAVIVFESTRVDGLDGEDLEHGMKGIHGQTTVRLMKVLKSMEPSVSLAKNMGL